MTDRTETELTNAELTAKLVAMEERLEGVHVAHMELAEEVDGTHERIDRVRSALHVAAEWIESEREDTDSE